MFQRDTTEMLLSLLFGELIMSTFHQFPNDRNSLEEHRGIKVISARELIIGHIVVIVVILLAIYLRSL